MRQSLLTFAALLSCVRSLDLYVQSGYHVIYSYTGTTPPSELYNYINQGIVGGVILFGDNIDSNTAANMNSLQAAYAKTSAYAGSPLLIVTDQEGGQVRRLPGGPTQSEKQIGASSNPSSAATTAGQQAASALKAYKNNGNLAPVADVFRTAGDFDDKYQRSYSNNATIAGTCTSAFITAQQSSKIMAAAKHFPGLGSASANQDTDAGPVTLNLPLDQIRSIDEVPFQSAIKAGTGMIMASWALYPALDSTYPAGLSSKWIQGELRGRLGFTGVTITDAIEAGGLNNFGTDAGKRAVLASVAGMDLILAAGRDPAQGAGIVDALVAAIDNDTISRSAFDAASQRILTLRKKL